MMTPLGEAASSPPRRERRGLRRLTPVAGVIPAEITTSDGQTFDAVVTHRNSTAAGTQFKT